MPPYSIAQAVPDQPVAARPAARPSVRPGRIVAAGAVVGLAAACGPATAAPPGAEPSPAPSPTERAARADSVRRHYTRADVDFMRGMIHHHAQALVMSRMAPTHGASPVLQTLAARIINGQKDEIALMQRWLRDRGEPVPEVREDGRMAGQGEAHGGGHVDPATMAGMLTPAQMARLEAAHGSGWDTLFLRFMIQHHKGALVMVEELFATPGAGQGDATFRIASDIAADQASEIERMQRMLADRISDTTKRTMK